MIFKRSCRCGRVVLSSRPTGDVRCGRCSLGWGIQLRGARRAVGLTPLELRAASRISPRAAVPPPS